MNQPESFGKSVVAKLIIINIIIFFIQNALMNRVIIFETQNVSFPM